jgi:hypothetical protein
MLKKVQNTKKSTKKSISGQIVRPTCHSKSWLIRHKATSIILNEINKKLKKAVFIIETPSDFRKNIEPLDEKPPEKGN